MSRRLIPAIAATVFALSACTSQVGGQATPSATGSSTAASPTDTFASLSPCKILDQALAGQGFPAATPTVADAKESCRSSKTTVGSTPGMDVGVSLQPGRNYQDNVTNPSQASTGTVHDRPAIEEREPQHSPGQCAVRLDVKPNSRALVLVSSSADTDTACKAVEGLAEKVEPLLPKNS